MTVLLITNAALMVLALSQAVTGILFFRPTAAVTAFFFQSLFLFASTILVVGFVFPMRFICGWLCVALFIYLFLLGFREWKVKGIKKL